MIVVADYRGMEVCYRPGTSDWNVINEMFHYRVYRKKMIDFDVEPGECWLDLGANIGAFAMYCKSRGASWVTCYEPLLENFEILKRNAPWAEHIQAVVTASTARVLAINYSKDSYSRATTKAVRGYTERVVVPNVFIGDITERYDGVKMDIEGDELAMLDREVLPNCNKLVMEYHLTRDPSPDNLKRRIEFLKSQFRTVHYRAELDRVADGKGRKTFFDREIFCKDRVIS